MIGKREARLNPAPTPDYHPLPLPGFITEPPSCFAPVRIRNPPCGPLSGFITELSSCFAPVRISRLPCRPPCALEIRLADTKKPTPENRCRYLWQGIKSDSPFDLVGTEASGTSVHMARSTVDNRLDPLDIGLPCTIGTSVRVRDLDTEGHALTTKITLRHSLHLPSD